MVIDMKKILVLFVIACSLFCMLCACKSGEENVTDPAAEPSVTGEGEIKPVEKETIDWETPIDVDDSFAEDTTPSVDTPTDPSDETGPLTTVPVSDPANSEDPTDPTDSDVTEAPTEGTTEPTSTSSGSGPIELPMIPG